MTISLKWGGVISGSLIGRNVNNSYLNICSCTNNSKGSFITLNGENNNPGIVAINCKDDNNSSSALLLYPDGTATWCNKNLAMQEDTVPRSGVRC